MLEKILYFVVIEYTVLYMSVMLSNLIVLFTSSVFFQCSIYLFLSIIESKILKAPQVLLNCDFSFQFFLVLFFVFVALWLGAYKLVIVISP